MPSYKLTYFNGRGKAEVSRMVFALADQAYTDERIQQEDWPKRKPATPFGSLPTLEVDGVVLCQSHAIEKYLGKLFGYAGETPMEEAQVDMVKGCFEDIGQGFFKAISGKQDEEKAEAMKKHIEETLVPQQQKIEKMLVDNGGKYLVGKKLTVADIQFTVLARFMEGMGAVCNWESIPNLKALLDRVEKEPKIAEWIAKRPETAF